MQRTVEQEMFNNQIDKSFDDLLKKRDYVKYLYNLYFNFYVIIDNNIWTSLQLCRDNNLLARFVTANNFTDDFRTKYELNNYFFLLEGKYNDEEYRSIFTSYGICESDDELQDYYELDNEGRRRLRLKRLSNDGFVTNLHTCIYPIIYKTEEEALSALYNSYSNEEYRLYNQDNTYENWNW